MLIVTFRTIVRFIVLDLLLAMTCSPLLSSILLLPTILLASGCANGQEASKGNFKRIVGHVLEQHQHCIARTLPQAVPLHDGKAQPNSQVKALLKVGLAEEKPALLDANLLGYIPAKSTTTSSVPGILYQLSEKGKKYEGSTTGMFGGTIPGLCYATPEIVDVLRYTEPVNTEFGRVTHVTYSYRLSKIADWVKDPGIITAFFLQKDLASANQIKEGRISLVLTSEGWRDKP